MRRMLFRSLLFLGLSLALLLGFSPSRAHADSLFVFPPSGLPGTSFQIQAGGFGGSENVELWTQYPDGRIVRLASATANGSGNVTFVVGTDSSFPFGPYLLLAHGTVGGNNVFGQLAIGASGSGGFATGTGFCVGQNFFVPNFSSGELVAFTAQHPNGSIQPLIAVAADGSGKASFTVPLQPGLPVGTYIITAQGFTSGHQTSDSLTFDGTTLSGRNCSMQLAVSATGYVPSAIPKNIVEYRGPGVYLNTDPNQVYYFDCSWKWRPMGGITYFLVLGFQPYEQVRVSDELFGYSAPVYYTTISADGFGNAVLAVNTTVLPRGHHHVWFSAPSVSYCGHFDLQ